MKCSRSPCLSYAIAPELEGLEAAECGDGADRRQPAKLSPTSATDGLDSQECRLLCCPAANNPLGWRAPQRNCGEWGSGHVRRTERCDERPHSWRGRATRRPATDGPVRRDGSPGRCPHLAPGPGPAVYSLHERARARPRGRGRRLRPRLTRRGGLPLAAGRGSGISNVRGRLEPPFDADSSVVIEPGPLGGTEARITIPYRRAMAAVARA